MYTLGQSSRIPGHSSPLKGWAPPQCFCVGCRSADGVDIWQFIFLCQNRLQYASRQSQPQDMEQQRLLQTCALWSQPKLAGETSHIVYFYCCLLSSCDINLPQAAYFPLWHFIHTSSLSFLFLMCILPVPSSEASPDAILIKFTYIKILVEKKTSPKMFIDLRPYSYPQLTHNRYLYYLRLLFPQHGLHNHLS